MLPFAHTLVSDSVSSFLRELFDMYSPKHNLRSANKLVTAKGSTSFLFSQCLRGTFKNESDRNKMLFHRIVWRYSGLKSMQRKKIQSRIAGSSIATLEIAFSLNQSHQTMSACSPGCRVNCNLSCL